MVAVLAAVLVMAASIWIAIFLEPRLGMLPTRATLAWASQPACADSGTGPRSQRSGGRSDALRGSAPRW